MDITFVICKENTSELIQTAARVLGPSKVVTCGSFNGRFDNCGSAAIVWDHRAEPDIQGFVDQYADQLKTKRIVLLCEDNAEDHTDHNFQDSLAVSLGDSVVWSGYIAADGFQSAKEETADKLVAIKRRLKDTADMPKDLLLEKIKHFLTTHNTCTLCTGFDGRVRATPIEYLYWNGALYFLSEGGEKFASLQFNPHVSVAVYDAYTGFQNLGGLQVQGKVQMVPLFGGEYNEIVTQKGLNAANMPKLPVILHMFKILPERFELLDSSLSKINYGAKQVLEL